MKYSVPVLLLTLALASGCIMFPTKTKKATAQKEPPPAAEIESEFRNRWIDRRIHELMGSGTAKTEAEARATAAAEFIKQFPYIRPEPTKTKK